MFNTMASLVTFVEKTPPSNSDSLVNLKADLVSVFKKLNLDNKCATPDLPLLEPALFTTTDKEDKLELGASLAETLMAATDEELNARTEARDNII